MSESREGIVLETGGGRYRVALEEDPETTVETALRGRLKKEARTGDRVVIGDRVTVKQIAADGDEAPWAIEAVDTRATEIVRRGGSLKRPKIMAANVDVMIVVVAAVDPAPRLDTVDRLLVIAESNGIEPRLVLNKIDLPGGPESAADFVKLYEGLGYSAIAASAETGEGIDGLRGWIGGKVSALIGPSGVGKSSLLNAIDPSLGLAIGALSRKLARGRHTTVNSRLIPVEGGGWVADTPGFGDVGVWGVDPEKLADAFPEFEAPAERCRFRGCSHVHEPGCGIREAVEEGEVASSRYESYVALHETSVEDTTPRY